MNVTFRNGLLLVILIVSCPIFQNLGGIPLQLWDESRLANSALEMRNNSNLLIPTFDGLPDMWSTKPPLLIWIQALFIQIFGTNELSLRLPSALAALMTCIFIYCFLHKLKMGWAGIISVLILITTAGYNTIHGTRTADYDSLLVLFITLYTLHFYTYMQHGAARNLIASAIFITLAALTKGIAGITFVPALFLYSLYTKKAGLILKNKTFYLGLSGFILFVGGYYLLREHYNPGYIDAIKENELGGRFLEANDNNLGGSFYYFKNLITYQYTYWLPFFLIACVYLLAFRSPQKEFVKYLLIVTGFFFIIINLSRTKLEWYIMPVFPFMAIVTGIFIYELCLKIKVRCPASKALPFIFLTLIILQPLCATMHRTLYPSLQIKSNEDANELAACLSKILHNETQPTQLKVIWNEYQGPISFYIKALQQSQKPVGKAYPDSLSNGDEVILYEPEMRSEIEKRYYTTSLEKGRYVTRLKIVGTK